MEKLPATERGLQWTLNALQKRIFEDCIIAEGRSRISWCDLTADEDIEKLNELAKRIQDLENLECYDYYPLIAFSKAYGTYVLKETGMDLQDPVFLNFDFGGCRFRRLSKAGHICTTYGVILRNESPFQHEYTAMQSGMMMT
ncbi:MAG: hypothetical protein ACLT46_03735 [Hungatella sp.]